MWRYDAVVKETGSYFSFGEYTDVDLTYVRRKVENKDTCHFRKGVVTTTSGKIYVEY